ncbi:MAG: polysaccharide export protein EpsE [Proteobacteria bacterium]|nr:polysaccharide export protein EpsE [Pseudomonadota bacterium]HQR03418.1 polysaccharide export protein EpsE [Rhodocyclaceae bacterium]
MATKLKQWIAKCTFMVMSLLLAAGAIAQGALPDYRLGEGDNIRISVFQNTDLTLETRVSENGMITFPLIGAIKIGGMTIASAEQAIAKALQDGSFVKKPQVSILLLKNLGNQVSVIGQVGHPGRFPLETFNTRLTEILAMAGGVLPDGADTVIITGVRDGKPFRREVDVAGMFLNNDFKDDITVAGGDVIFVAKHPVFYVYGEVQHPGSYRLERNMTVRQALAQGGGLTDRGTERGLDVYRRGSSGERVGVKGDDKVQPDDVIYVGESLF